MLTIAQQKVTDPNTCTCIHKYNLDGRGFKLDCCLVSRFLPLKNPVTLEGVCVCVQKFNDWGMVPPKVHPASFAKYLCIQGIVYVYMTCTCIHLSICSGWFKFAA